MALGLFLARLLIGAAIGAVAVGVTAYVINRVITRDEIRKFMAQEKISKAILNKVDRCENKLTLQDLMNKTEHSMEGTGISADLREGETISL